MLTHFKTNTQLWGIGVRRTSRVLPFLARYPNRFYFVVMNVKLLALGYFSVEQCYDDCGKKMF